MKTALLSMFVAAAFAFRAVAADAFEVEKGKQWLKEASYSCESGEATNGEKLDSASIIAACRETIALIVNLNDAGYCMDATRKEWVACN